MDWPCEHSSSQGCILPEICNAWITPQESTSCDNEPGFALHLIRLNKGMRRSRSRYSVTRVVGELMRPSYCYVQRIKAVEHHYGRMLIVSSVCSQSHIGLAIALRLIVRHGHCGFTPRLGLSRSPSPRPMRYSFTAATSRIGVTSLLRAARPQH